MLARLGCESRGCGIRVLKRLQVARYAAVLKQGTSCLALAWGAQALRPARATPRRFVKQRQQHTRRTQTQTPQRRCAEFSPVVSRRRSPAALVYSYSPHPNCRSRRRHQSAGTPPWTPPAQPQLSAGFCKSFALFCFLGRGFFFARRSFAGPLQRMRREATQRKRGGLPGSCRGARR